jgi:glycosyltransferase involved in cell wall biosynthesis
VEYLLQAWRAVEERDQSFELRIAGEGPMATRLRRKATRLGLRRVRFLGDVDESLKKDLLAKAALFVLPTLIEGLGIALLEAMASGVPVLSTNAWGIRDIVRHGYNGILVNPRNSGRLGEEILKFFDHRREYEIYAVNGWKTVQRYSWNVVTDCEVALLNEIPGFKKTTRLVEPNALNGLPTSTERRI